jgi:sugar lactone lactonase YvrE
LLQDARNIGVDGNGNIVIGDYEDGRIQVFDPKGKFLSSFSLGPKVYLSAIAVNRDGTIYAVHDQKIFVYDENGNQIQEIGDDQHRYEDVTIGEDGKLYAIADDETIIRFKPDRSIDLEIPNTFSNATGDSELDSHLAVDGLGDMYIVGSFNYAVLKFSPTGKLMNRFGSQGDGAGKFTSPEDIAVDGYGRVYVSDFWGILVFDSNGAYLKTIDINSGVGFGVVFDGDNNLYVVTSQNQVFRYQIQKPQSD